MIKENDLMKLNLGCGFQVVEGWVNTDYSLGARASRYPLIKFLAARLKVFSHEWSSNIYLADLTVSFPWRDNEIDVIYSSHVLEHLDKQQGKNFISECHRVLKPGGIIRVIVPNLDEIIRLYNEKQLLADDFIDYLDVRPKYQESFIKRLVSNLFSFPHKCMYSPERLTALMAEVGIVGGQKSPLLSGIADIRSIELEDRVANNEVIFEGVKR
ncbi:methyltransferase domain-containing protein [Gammaproteobacteria bacterium]|nr:methyltransferase domain-containing protein [Gammaproteobacteria bacterium]